LTALGEAVARAFVDAGATAITVDAACLGLAGFGRPEDQRLLRDWSDQRGLARCVVTVTDGDLIVAAGTPEGWGVGIIAGTGSIAVGRDRQGRTARAGGWGHLFGDEGSAYAVVLAALRRVARRADGRDSRPSRSDPLTVRLCAALGVDEPMGLVPTLYAPGIDRTAIAALAPIVLEAAGEDPTIIAEVLEPAGRELAEAVMAVARSLGWSSGTLPLALAGGFLLASRDVTRSLIDQLERSGYQPVGNPVPDPVRGALILARQALDPTQQT
jgi:N-acetylglucosamine kinase-like BadF-type ATPase